MSVKKVELPKRRGGFRQGRIALGHAAGITFWGCVWMLNGWFTVKAWEFAVGGLGYTDYAQAMYGWIFHVVISLIQGMMWRGSRGNATLLTLLILGVIDVGSTAIGLRIEASRFMIVSTYVMSGVLTVSSLIIALVPEQMIVEHMRGMGLIK